MKLEKLKNVWCDRAVKYHRSVLRGLQHLKPFFRDYFFLKYNLEKTSHTASSEKTIRKISRGSIFCVIPSGLRVWLQAFFFLS